MGWTETEQAVVLGGAALGVVVQWVVKPAIRFVRTVTSAMSFIEHELKENSGRSLRDVANRTERRFDYLFKHLGIEMPDNLKAPEEDPHVP